MTCNLKSYILNYLKYQHLLRIYFVVEIEMYSKRQFFLDCKLYYFVVVPCLKHTIQHSFSFSNAHSKGAHIRLNTQTGARRFAFRCECSFKKKKVKPSIHRTIGEVRRLCYLSFSKRKNINEEK